MKEVSVFYIDEVNNAIDLLFGLSVLLEGVGKICKEDGGRKGIEEALQTLDNICFDMAKRLRDTPQTVIKEA